MYQMNTFSTFIPKFGCNLSIAHIKSERVVFCTFSFHAEERELPNQLKHHMDSRQANLRHHTLMSPHAHDSYGYSHCHVP